MDGLQPLAVGLPLGVNLNVSDQRLHQVVLLRVVHHVVQTLEIGQVIADKFLHKLIIMDGGFLQLLKSLADTQASHFQSLSGHQGILVKKRNL